LLQSTHGDNQIGPFENFHQFVENALVVVGSWLEALLQYALRFADGLKNQLLISHPFLPIQCRSFAGKRKFKSNFGIIPSTFVSGAKTSCFVSRMWRPVAQLGQGEEPKVPRDRARDGFVPMNCIAAQSCP
jgi:hypothetical protein